MYKEAFRNMAVSLIEKFAGELGPATYKSRSKVYDYQIGSQVITSTTSLNAAFIRTVETVQKNNLKDGESICYIAGKELPYMPKRMDIIIDQDGNTWHVVEAITDMYRACHILKVKQVET